MSSLAFSPGGSMLAVGGKNRVHLYDVATGSLRKKWKSGSAGLAFSPDGKRLLTVSTRGNVAVQPVPARKK
ncbi:MAG: WD40 repeat domain-containing protein [Planctomycetota bacterium]